MFYYNCYSQECNGHELLIFECNIGLLEEIGLFPATREGETQGRCLPVVTEEDINDRSKSDSFTKAFTIIQYV